MLRVGAAILLAAVMALACGEAGEPDAGALPASPAIVPTDPADLDVGAAQRRQLESLGYVNAVPLEAGEEDVSGVTLHLVSSTQPGFNLFNSREQSIARLLDMHGAEVHRWTAQIRGRAAERFDAALPSYRPDWLEGWNHVEWLDGGDLLVIGSHHAFARIDADGSVVWQRDLAAHHDATVGFDGRIYVLADVARTFESAGREVALLDGEIVVLDSDGRQLRSHSLLEAFVGTEWEGLLVANLERIDLGSAARRVRSLLRHPDAGILERLRAVWHYLRAYFGAFGPDGDLANILFVNSWHDVFHANSVQLLPETIPGLWRRGDLLVSIHNMNLVVVVDRETGKLIWAWGRDALQAQHHATQTRSGMVIFDNGIWRGHSRILEISPRTGRIRWQYQADPPEHFFTDSRGSVQPLDNGSFLVSETNTGRVFEVTREGRIVWEYHNESIHDGRRGAIYRMVRIPPEAVAALLAR